MSLQLILGGSGSGKSNSAYNDIIRHSIEFPNTNHYVIVPDQFTLQTQKEIVALTERCGIMNIDVTSFTRLGFRVFERLGKLDLNPLDDMGKTLILRKLASNLCGKLGILGGSFKRMGYIGEIKSIISEFKQYGINRDELDALIEYAKDRVNLSGKLKELKLLYMEFEQYIEDKYVTSQENLSLLAELLSEYDDIRGSIIVLDGFTGFTPIQKQCIKKMLELANKVVVTVTVDTIIEDSRDISETDLFAYSQKMIDGLRRLAFETDIKILPDIRTNTLGIEGHCHNSKELSYLESNIFRHSSKPYCGDISEDIDIMVANNPFDEMRGICHRIKKLTNEKGYRYSDIAIMLAGIDEYASYAKSILEEYEIPYFLDQNKGIALNCFIEYIRSSISIVLNNYDYESIFRYLRCGMHDVACEDIDILENYVLATGIRGRMAWNKSFENMTAQCNSCEQLEHINNLRSYVVKSLSYLDISDGDVGDMVVNMYQFIISNRSQERLLKYEIMFAKSGDIAKEKEYSKIYRLVCELLEQINELLAGEALTIEEFGQILDVGFSEMKVGIIPSSVDRIMVVDIERSRLAPIKHLFLAGLSDNNITGSTRGGVISDIDREFLANSGIELAPTPRQRAYILRFYLYLSLTKPSQGLSLSYSKNDSEGNGVSPSYVISVIKKMYPYIKVSSSISDNIEERIYSIKDVKEAFSHLIAMHIDGRLDKKSKDYCSLLATDNRLDMEASEWKTRIKELIERDIVDRKLLDSAMSKLLYGDLIKASVTRLEMYANCRFAHYMKYGLRMRERDIYQLENTDMGNLYHDSLELISENIIKQGFNWRELSREHIDDLVECAKTNVVENYKNTLMKKTGLNSYLIRKMESVLKRSLDTISYQLSKGKFTPEYFEHEYEWSTELGVDINRTMKVHGKIDRIDTYYEDSNVYVKVIDYKSGSRQFDAGALYYGLQLQLIAYMIGTQKMKEWGVKCVENVIPAGMLYYHINDPMIEVEEIIPDDKIEGKIKRELRPTGLLNDDITILNALDFTASDGYSSDVVPFKVNKSDGSLSKDSHTYSAADIQIMCDYAEEKMKEMGREIINGNIDINPIQYKEEMDSCMYCDYKNSCPYDKKIHVNKKTVLDKLDVEDSISKMKTRLNYNS